MVSSAIHVHAAANPDVIILLLNMLVGFSLEKRATVSHDELSKLRVAHISWTVNWLLRLISWFVITKSEQTSVILNDLAEGTLSHAGFNGARSSPATPDIQGVGGIRKTAGGIRQGHKGGFDCPFR
jgi:hypothetical protein